MCRQWHAENREASSEHYRDVVVPFRREQPSYQRRWRLGRRLSEIREQLSHAVDAVGARVQAVLEQASALLQQAVEPTQSGVITKESLPDVLSAATTVLAALEQLATCSAALTV